MIQTLKCQDQHRPPPSGSCTVSLLPHPSFSLLRLHPGGMKGGVGQTCRDEVPVLALVQCLAPQSPAKGFPVSGTPLVMGSSPPSGMGSKHGSTDQRGQDKEPGAAAASRHRLCGAQ